MADLDIDASKWKTLIAEWEQLGFDPKGLFHHLGHAKRQRRLFEEQLRCSRYEPDPRIQTLKSALVKAAPLITFVKTEVDDDHDPVFPELTRGLAELGTYLATLKRLDRERRHLPAHRPGDSWLLGHVLELARHLRVKRTSWRQIATWIHRLFVLAGHADVVSEDKVRHILRQKLRRQPDFGKPLPLNKLPWRQRPAEMDSYSLALAGFRTSPRRRALSKRRKRSRRVRRR